MQASGFNAVIFDLDGTLLDSLDELGGLCNRVLDQNGYPVHAMDRYRYFVGDGSETLIRRALGEAASPETIERCLDEFLALYHDTCGMNARLYPDIPELLDELQLRNIPLAILSNKPHDLTLKNVDLFLPGIPFHTVFGQRDGVPKKPDPRAAMEILTRLGLRADQCLYLGDTSVDMKTAGAAGMIPVGVLWGFRDEAELRESGAKHIISHPRELLALIDG